MKAASLSIALDAMGGDRAPDMVVKGANIARQRFPNVSFLFFGDERRIAPLLDRHGALRKASEIRHTDRLIDLCRGAHTLTDAGEIARNAASA